MGKPPVIYMKQIMKQRWRVETASGSIMQDNITCSSFSEALEFIRKYASSWPDWRFEIVPLKEQK